MDDPKRPDFVAMANEILANQEKMPREPIPCKEQFSEKCLKSIKHEPNMEWPWGFRVCVPCGLNLAQDRTGIPVRYLEARLTDLTDAMQLVVEPLETKCGILHGTYGVGKTHAMAAVATEMIQREHRAFRWVVWGDLVREWRSTFNRNSNTTERDFMHKYGNAPRLFLDDLSDELGDDSSAVKKMLCDLVDMRYSARLHTVMTSNLDLQGLAEKFSHKMAGRIYEDGLVVKCIGENRRIKHA